MGRDKGLVKRQREPVEVLIDPNRTLLRISCGQCGHTKDVALDVREDGRVAVVFLESTDFTQEDEGAWCFMEPFHVLM